MIAVQEQNIPSFLKSQSNWIVWNLVGKTESFKGTKVPFQTKNPYLKASTTDPLTWSSFGESVAMAKLHGMSGVGYVFTEEQNIVAIDIDSCIIDGHPDENAQKLLSLFKGKTYIEKSVSGTGYHILCKGMVPENRKIKTIEVYTQGRYFAITGNIIDSNNDITECQDEINKLYDLFSEARNEPDKIHWIQNRTQERSGSIADKLNLRVQDIGMPDNYRLCGDGEVRGAHPFHGSTTGMNYAINIHKNAWICRRDGHNCGGGPLELFAVKEGIIRCEDVRSGCLDRKWREIFEALKKNGYDLVKAGIEKKQLEKKPPAENEREFNTGIEFQRCTDFGNAERFLLRYANTVVYCCQNASWYVWDGKGFWNKDALGTIREMVKKTFLSIYNEIEVQETTELRSAVATWALQCEKPHHINACLDVAQSDPRVVVTIDKFDTDKNLFNFLNGTYDLKNHLFLPHDKENYITRQVQYDYDSSAQCPHFLTFLNRIFKSRRDKNEIIDYLQRALGYSLTGEISQQIVFLLHGSGSNGKSTLLETQRMIMGDYGTTIDSGSLTTKKNDSVRNDIARLPNIRFVVASENAKGTIIDEELIKKLTGGDQVTARFLFQEEFNFYPQLKLWWAFNHPPGVRDLTHSLMRRLKLIPFEERIPDTERIDQAVLLGLYRSELPGIFNWELEGLKRYQKEGLKDIDAISNAVKEFKEEQDRLHDWITDICYIPERDDKKDAIVKSDIHTSASVLCKSYNGWAALNNEKPMSQRKFSMELMERGFKRTHMNTGNVFHGIGIK
jgi:putative DNA primase/helicase